MLAPGRALDCARDAYGASRVMVNCNQMGEAAGRAAANALKKGLKAAEAYVAWVRFSESLLTSVECIDRKRGRRHVFVSGMRIGFA